MVLNRWGREDHRNIPRLVHQLLVEKNRNIVTTASENAMDRIGLADSHRREIVRGLTHSATQSHRAINCFSLSRAERRQETARSVRALRRELGPQMDSYKRHFGDGRRRMGNVEFQLARFNVLIEALHEAIGRDALTKSEVKEVLRVLGEYGEKVE
jgi:hypothetical protein